MEGFLSVLLEVTRALSPLEASRRDYEQLRQTDPQNQISDLEREKSVEYVRLWGAQVGHVYHSCSIDNWSQSGRSG